jgi:hypothetical protein
VAGGRSAAGGARGSSSSSCRLPAAVGPRAHPAPDPARCPCPWPLAPPQASERARSLRQSVNVTRLSRIALTNIEREGDANDYTAAQASLLAPPACWQPRRTRQSPAAAAAAAGSAALIAWRPATLGPQLPASADGCPAAVGAAAAAQAQGASIRIESADAELDFEEVREEGERGWGGLGALGALGAWLGGCWAAGGLPASLPACLPASRPRLAVQARVAPAG